MARKKVTLSYLANDAERKASLKKRRRGLIKKVRELSTLCGVEACAIIYSEYDSKPEVWPSQSGVLSTLSRFNRLPEMERSRKLFNVESFTRERVKKAEDQLQRLKRENAHMAMEIFMCQCMNGTRSIKDFNFAYAPVMQSVIDRTLRSIHARMKSLERGGEPHQPHINDAHSTTNED